MPALFVFTLTLFGPSLIADGDPYWHVAAGRWMLEHRSIIHAEPFSFAVGGRPWVAQEWLSEIIMGATYTAFGWKGLYILFGSVFALTTFLLARNLLRDLEPVPALYLLAFAIADFKGWVSMRPHVFVLPILILWTGELLTARKERRAPDYLVVFLLMALWVNLHASFLLGIALLVVFTVEAMIESFAASQRWAVASALALQATLSNPTGFAVFLPPFTISAIAPSLVPEWQASSFEAVTPFEISLLSGLLACLFLGVRVSAFRVLLLAGMVHLTLAHQRFLTVLAIVGAMILSAPMAEALERRGWYKGRGESIRIRLVAASGTTVGLCCLLTFFAPSRAMENSAYSPVDALAAVPVSVASQPVFNDWLFGGYLSFTGLHPYSDGRVELYGYDFLRDHLDAISGDKPAFDRAVARYDIRWTLLPATSPANDVLDSMEEWQLIYRDQFAAVHIRK